MADQQYCLRWNNHQTTLISVFESLQERGCMVDCTLAAEGQSLQAHKVVLSACSPYLEDLLSKHYDKHPILLLKDVKFEELKAMMDYMYRGEVNVAQDKLNTFLRAAESLQIKGLSDGGTDPPDSGGTGSMKRTAKGAPVSVRSNQQLTVRTTNLADDNSSRDGSVSPSLRKRRRRRGSDGSDHDNSSNVADGKQSSAAAAPVTGPTVINEDMLPTVPASGPSDDNLLSSILESTETENATDSGITSANNTVPLQENVIRDRDNVLIEPKTEYLDDDAQDLHLDDDDSMFRAGPSHARGSGNYEGDDGEDVYMANQDSGANAQGGAGALDGNSSADGSSSSHLPTWATIRSLLGSLPHLSVTAKPNDGSKTRPNIRQQPCSKCCNTPPTLLINTTLVSHTGLSRTEWRVVSSNSKEFSAIAQRSNFCKFDEEPDIQEGTDLNHGKCTSLYSFGEKSVEECNKDFMKKKKHTAIQVSTSLTNESTQVHFGELEDLQSCADIVPTRRNTAIRGRGSRGRRGRGGGRQRRGAFKVDRHSNDPQQTRSFRPRKSTCYLELPDEVEDYMDDEDDDSIKRHFSEEHKAEDFGNLSLRKLKKMMRKRSQSMQHTSYPTERNESTEEIDMTHGKNPLLLKLAKKTDSGAEWKVETVTKSEDLSVIKFDPQCPNKGKGETQKIQAASSTAPCSQVPRVRASSTDDSFLSEQEHASYPCSLSDSDIASAKSPKLEDLKKVATVPSESKAGISSPSTKRARAPYSKLLMTKKRQMFMKSKKSGALFRKALKECSEKSKMKLTTPLKAPCNSPKENVIVSAATPKRVSTPGPTETEAPSPKETLPVSPASPAVKSEVLAPTIEDVKPVRSAIFTHDKKNEKKSRFKEKKKIDDSSILSHGKFKCNLCDNYFQTWLAAKKHWINFHRVPGGSTSPSLDISGPDLSSNVVDLPNSAIGLPKPKTPPLPTSQALPILPPVPALQPLSSAPYAVPAPSPSISSYSFAPTFSTSQTSTTYQGAIVPNPLVTSASAPEKEQEAPLDLPVRFLDTI